MFSVFVVIVGLLGIASVFSMAGRNATDSNAQNNALTQGKVWLNDFYARRLNDHDAYSTKGTGFNWQWRNDGAAPAPILNYLKVGSSAAYPGLNYAGTNLAATGSAVTSGAGVRMWGHQAMCIDPVFMSDPAVVQRFNAGTSRVASFRAAVFPYFEDGHNPLEDPFASPTNAWHDQPRMIRTTLGGSAGQIPNKLVSELFASRDDLATSIDDKDKTVPARRIFSEGGAKSLTTGDFTWLATLTPEPVTSVNLATSASPTANQSTLDYTLSLVILEKRERQFIGTDITPGSGTNKPAGELLTWIYPLSGAAFTGGTGGRVRVISAANVSDTRQPGDSISVGDWIMFGKHIIVDDSATSTPPHRYAYFRWYRVIAVDGEARVDVLSNVSPTGTDPYGNGATLPVWSRDIVVEGPDWSFVPGVVSTMGNTYVTPTTGTVMNNVVTVIERNVTVD